MKAAGILWMFLFLIWLPIEDINIWETLALAAGGSLWLLFRVKPQTFSSWRSTLMWGLALGLTVPLLTISLMAFKGGAHGHGFPDFSVNQVDFVIQAIPSTIGLSLALMVALKGILNAKPRS